MMLRNMTLTLKFFCALSICATALALIPLAAHADYSHGNSGILMLSPNSLPGLTIGPAEQYVSAGTNTLQAWVKNDSNSTRTIYATKGVCRCQEAIGYPYRTGVGQCQYYWSPDSSSSRPGCQATNETITLPPYGSYLMSASVSQYNSQSCGSFQIDFYFDGKIWVGSFANIEINCPTPTIACSSDSQCGTNGYIDSPYCSSSLNIYQSYKTYTCKNPGTTSSYCSSETLSKLKNTCDDGEETCSNGYCIDNIPTLIASCSASPNPANTNQTVTFVPSVSGGTGSYSYSWTGACNGYSQNCSNAYSSSGSQIAYLQVTSGSQVVNTSCSTSVNASLTVSCTASPNPANTNQQVTFIPSVTGGTGIYSYAWSEDCSATSQNCTNTFGSSGAKTASLTVISGSETKTTSCSVSVNAVTITCSSNSDCGSNGYVDSAYCSGSSIYQNYRTYTCYNPGTTNSYCSNSTSSQSKQTCGSGQSCTNGSCTNNLSASCYASPNPANTNQTVTFVPSVSGGTGSYSYSWTGACNGYSQNCNNSFSSSGTQTAFLQITSESQTANTSCQVSVNQSCNSNSYKQCYNDDVYWYDSCGNRGSRYQECNSSQACYNGTCIGQSNYTYTYNTTTATLNKTVINLSSGALNYSASVAANPNNIVQFRVIIQNGSNQTISNITVRDVLPSRLSYYGLITLDGAAISGNLASGLYISNLAPGQQKTVTYQAQLASDQNFSFGTTTLTNIASLTSTDSSFIPVSASAYVNVTRTGVAGATSVPTGWSDSLLSGSLLVPFLAAIAAVWFLNRGEQKIPTWVGSASRKKEG